MHTHTTHTHTHIAFLQPLCRSPWVSWLPCGLNSSHSYADRLHRTAPNSSYQHDTLGFSSPHHLH